MGKHLVGVLVSTDRKEKGMTLKDYSKELGISPSYLSDIEKGRRLVLPDLIPTNNILKHLGYRVEIKLNKIEGYDKEDEGYEWYKSQLGLDE